MTASLFDAQIRQLHGQTTIDLYGEINSFAQAKLNEAYTRAESSEQPVIILNFSQVSYINSTGIALIVGLLTRARKTGRKLVVYGLSDHYKEIFQITRLADFMPIYPDEASIVAATA